MRKLNFALLIALLLVTAMPAEAQSSAGSIGTMFANGTATWVAGIKALKIVSYLFGAYLIVSAIMEMPKLGDGQGKTTPKKPIIMFIIGIALFTLIGMLDVVSTTMSMGSGAGNALLGKVEGGSGTMAAAITGVLTFIRMIGYIAFIRGWLMLNASAQGKDGVMGKSLTHIIGGVAAINVKTTAYMLAATFAPGVPIATYLG